MLTAAVLTAVRTRASAGAVKVKDPGGIKWLRRGDGVAVLTAARARALALVLLKLSTRGTDVKRRKGSRDLSRVLHKQSLFYCK